MLIVLIALTAWQTVITVKLIRSNKRLAKSEAAAAALDKRLRALSSEVYAHKEIIQIK